MGLGPARSSLRGRPGRHPPTWGLGTVAKRPAGAGPIPLSAGSGHSRRALKRHNLRHRTDPSPRHPRGKHVGTPRTCHATWHNPATQTEKPHDCATPEISRSGDKTREGSAGDLPHGSRTAWDRGISHALRHRNLRHRTDPLPRHPRGKHVSIPRTCHTTWHNPATQTEKPHTSAVPR